MTDPHATPAVADEIRAKLEAAGYTVRRLKAKGFGGRTADLLLGKAEGLPSLDSADRALALLGRELWHRPRHLRSPKPN